MSDRGADRAAGEACGVSTADRPGAALGGVTGVQITRTTATSRRFLAVAPLVVLVLALLPLWGDAGLQRKMIELFTLLSLAQMWNLLAGYAGVVSVGQQAFVGLGAYGMVAFINVQEWNPYVSVPVSALVGALLSIPIGLVAFRLRGSYFAIGTWVLADAVSLVIIQQTSLGAGNGASLAVAGYDLVTRQRVTYWLALVAGVGAVALAYAVLRSRFGLQLQAIRDDEAGAQGLGADVYRTRFVIWVVAAFWTAYTGAVFYLSSLRVQPRDSFSVVQWTAPIIIIVLIGGLGSIEGPVIGAVLYYVLRDRFNDYETLYTIGSGVVAIGVALYLQPGLWGYLRRRYELDLFPVRRLVRLPDRS
jgi:branched-chain amino acid transport system permease protein